jgi:mannose-6-phosphate isomerase-like protein (cupin superfamily)
MTESIAANAPGNMEEYNIGDTDTRPWGSYTVTDVGTNDQGEDFCEKEITVNPGKILSLQSHELRRELWTVRSGTLTVILDGKRLELAEGQSVSVPLQAIHCMANLSDTPCIVFERQEGICREEDIARYVDAYGRAAQTAEEGRITDSIALYNGVLEEIGTES